MRAFVGWELRESTNFLVAAKWPTEITHEYVRKCFRFSQQGIGLNSAVKKDSFDEDLEKKKNGKLRYCNVKDGISQLEVNSTTLRLMKVMRVIRAVSDIIPLLNWPVIPGWLL